MCSIMEKKCLYKFWGKKKKAGSNLIGYRYIIISYILRRGQKENTLSFMRYIKWVYILFNPVISIYHMHDSGSRVVIESDRAELSIECLSLIRLIFFNTSRARAYHQTR